jgi:hypothetical protein
VRVAQVVEIALARDVLPQKSTDFYPKLLSGLTVFRVEGRLEGSSAAGSGTATPKVARK